MKSLLVFVLTAYSTVTLAQVPSISIGTIAGGRDSEMPMIADGIVLANKVLATDCFRQFILNANFTENNGLSQEQIYELMRQSLISVNIEMYTGNFIDNHWNKTIGFENDPFDGIVHMNRHFVNSSAMVADNVIHEALGHSLGFHHYGVKATSVPYGTNLAFEACNQ